MTPQEDAWLVIGWLEEGDKVVRSKTRNENESQIIKGLDCLTQESRHDLEKQWERHWRILSRKSS